MIAWIFGAMTLAAVLMATFETQIRRAILALWVAGIGVGAVYLTVGAEFLAIIQWIVSTLVAISFIFFAVLFGEYYPAQKIDESPVSLPNKKSHARLMVVLALILGGVFAVTIGLGSRHLVNHQLTLVPEESDLGSLGRKLTQDHILSLEVLALTLFLVLVGGGVIARSEGDNS